MCDEIDQLTDSAAAEAEFAARVRAIEEGWRLTRAPALLCSDCEEPLSELRQSMRCSRCVGCQAGYEQKRKLFGKGLMR
jgi:predicted amidophosphoribosyltransferase